MNPRAVTHFTIALACVAAMSACQTTAPQAPRTTVAPRVSRPDLERQLAESRALLERYEKRYGKLLPSRPVHDFRKLRTELKGKPMSDVVARLGKPDNVYSPGSTESWDYTNVAYDSVSGRTVRTLEVWFRNGVVDYMTAMF